MGCTNSKAAKQNASSTTQSLEDLVSQGPNSQVKPKAEMLKGSVPSEPIAKSGTSSTLASIAALIPSISLKTQTIYSGVAIGAAVLCRDSFNSKYSGELMHKWRKAEIINIEGNDRAKVLIHFVGWADKFNQWIDLNSEMDKIAPLSLLSKAQCDNGGILDEDQLKTTRTYLTTGKFVPVSMSSDSTSPSSSTSAAAAAAASSTNGKAIKRMASGQSAEFFNAATSEYKVGQLLDVLDIFCPVGSEILKSKWRKAKVLNVSGRLLRISYIGWDSKFDENLDVVVDCDRISPVGTKTIEQTSRQITEIKNKKSPKPASKQEKARNGIAFGDITGDLRKLGKSIVGGSKKNKESNSSNNSNGLQTESVNGTASNDEGNGEIKEEGTIEVNENFEEETDDAIARSAEALQAEIEKERRFIEALARKGLHVIEIEGDGNCLFRAISHQLYLNEDHHEALRRQCVEHLVYHKKRFSLFCTEDFEEHVKEMSKVGIWGDELEIRALEEIIDRTIRIYSSDSPVADKAINTNFEEESLLKGVTPIYLAYHGLNHYNSIYCESNPLPLSLRPSRVLLQARISLFEESNKPKAAAPNQQRQVSNGGMQSTSSSKVSAIAEQQQLLLQQVQQQQNTSPSREPLLASHPGLQQIHSGQMRYTAPINRGYSNNAMESRRASVGAPQMSGHQQSFNSQGVIGPNRAGAPYSRGPSFGGNNGSGISPSYR